VPDRLERQLVPKNYPLHTVRCGGLQGKGGRQLLSLLQLLQAIQAVRRLIRREHITAVFSTGGYIAAPAILAARWCRVPVVLHESNAMPGRVTRLLGRHCTRLAIGLPQAAQRLRGCRPVVTGTPVRREFLNPTALPPWVPQGKGPLLVVMGGSQGAVGLNRMVRPLFQALVANGVRVVHLTGSNDPEAGQITLAGVVERPFSDEIGTPAILVPYPAAADQHQEANAAAAAALGAAVIVHQHGPEAPGLGLTLWRLLGPRLRGAAPPADPLVAMGAGMHQLANTRADQELAQLLQQLVPHQGPTP